ncbi:hypothetical protein AAG906_007974 [Vitis piasezkii]
MEENGHGSGDGSHWWWALASAAQLGWGVFSYRRGGVGDSRLMPVKAFGVEDLKEMGANIRTGLGVRPREPRNVLRDGIFVLNTSRSEE